MDELTQILEDMMKEISSKSSSKPDIRGYMQRINTKRKELGDKLHPTLRHYLERCSYAKALNFIKIREEQE